MVKNMKLNIKDGVVLNILTAVKENQKNNAREVQQHMMFSVMMNVQTTLGMTPCMGKSAVTMAVQQHVANPERVTSVSGMYSATARLQTTRSISWPSETAYARYMLVHTLESTSSMIGA